MPEHKAKQNRRRTLAGLIMVSAATALMLAWAVFPTAAFADGTIPWDGQGFSQDCPNGGHWNFQESANVTSATLHVNGETITMSMQGNHWTANSSGPITDFPGTTASVDFVGSAPDGFLTLSSCLGGTTTTPGTTTTQTTTTPGTTTTETTTTPGTTTSETTTSQTTTSSTSSTTTPGTTVSGTTVTPPSSSSTPPQGTTVSGTTVTPGGTAFTGFEDVVPLGAVALALMTGGTGLMWAGSRRRRKGLEDEDEDE